MKRFSLLCTIGLACASMPSPAARAADAAVDPDWFPLRASEWVYEVHRDQTYRPDDANIRRLFHTGRTTRVALPASDRAPGGFRVRDTTVLQPMTDLGGEEKLSEWTVFSFRSGLSIHAAGETRADGTETEITYEPPLRILPTVAIGESWSAGTFQGGGLRAPLRGEVLGHEDLTGKPAWPGALKVQLKGKISGSAPGPQMPTETESGDYERLLWFVHGVGVVREVTTVQLELRLPEDRRANTIQVLTLRLVDHASPQ